MISHLRMSTPKSPGRYLSAVDISSSYAHAPGMSQRRPQHLHQRLATNVKQRRDDLGLSQEQLALEADLHRTYIGAIERAERNPTLATLELLAAALGCDPFELLTRA